MPNTNNRREEILQIALSEFTREGYSGARLQSMADKTGVTKAMIHYYFKTKENLFRETFQVVCQNLIADLFSPLEDKKPLFTKIDAFVDKVIKRFSRNPKQAHFLVSELNRHGEITLDVFNKNYKCDLTVLDQQIKEASGNYQIAPVTSDQLIANILSLAVFSSSERAFLKAALNKNEQEFESFLQKRNEIIKDTIMNWLTG